ncbi:MAG TPA: response regulator transcription factor, partial [Herpetosiphonaceae bacterium]
MADQRVLIVEDDLAVARGLEYGLASEGWEVCHASTGQLAALLVRQRDPHLIILDIRLPDASGFDLCRQLRADGFTQPILMLTARDEEFDRVLGLEMGADDYMIKPFSLRELIARLRAMFRRSYGDLAAPAAGKRITFGDIELDLERLQVLQGGRPVLLTPTEFRLLRHLASNPGYPFSREALIDVVWGYDSWVGNERTVDVHIRHLREKL